MKILKYSLIGLGGLVVLAVIGVAVFAMTFDPNKYKGQIEAAVKEKTGRVLKLEGNLKVAVFPSLGADVAKVSLSERQADQEFLSLDSAHASVALLPLLRGEVIVDRIKVAGLKAHIVKGKDGKFNFDDLLEAKGDKGAAKKAPEKGDAKSSQPVRFDIAGINIDRSSVLYEDLASGQKVSLADVKLATGSVSEKADGKLELGATVAASEKGAKPLNVRISLNSGYHADLAAKAFALSSLTSEINVSGADMPKPLKVVTTGSLKADMEKQTASAELVSKIDETTIQSRLGVTKFSPAAITFDISGDKLNLDQYFPPKQKGSAS